MTIAWVVSSIFVIINMSSWSSCSSASSSTCTSCSLVLLGGSAMSTLPCVWLTCAFGRSKRGETQLVCWCAFLESAWCPVWDPRRQPGAWGGAAAGSLARILAGVRAGGSNPDRGHGRVKPGSGKGPVKSGSGTRAGQIRNGRSATKIKNKKRERKRCGCNHTGRVATTAVITGLTTTRGYNRSWNRGPRGCGCNQSLNLDRVSGAVVRALVSNTLIANA